MTATLKACTHIRRNQPQCVAANEGLLGYTIIVEYFHSSSVELKCLWDAANYESSSVLIFIIAVGVVSRHVYDSYGNLGSAGRRFT